MKRFLALSLILGVTSFGLVGCGEETKVEEPKVEAPGEPAKDAKTDAPAAPDKAEAPAVPPADAPAVPPADAPK
ncbi:hypothetical protein SAMN05444166_8213 [Singulisphaera sp. GP187]|uniref:hypothetical protein n=1 Tax=Singulisphaera sp. GP187 TaxID=1882752 RepID=UPI00092B1D3A|nr:hypothetical protein [Singulisphaera sp. GP187]SIO66767.1 hypothetical protein SAMN05444166_8213 [Singulisphaera sp. GP187]